MVTEEKEYMYIPKDLAAKLKELETPERQAREIEDYINKSRDLFRLDLDGLNDDLLAYRSMMSKWHMAVKGAYEEQAKKAESLWEDFDNSRPKLSAQIIKAVAQVKPLQTAVAELKRSFDSVNLHQINSLLDTIERINNLSDKDLERLKTLFAQDA